MFVGASLMLGSHYDILAGLANRSPHGKDTRGRSDAEPGTGRLPEVY